MRLALGSISSDCRMTAVEDIFGVAFGGTGFGGICFRGIAFVAITVRLRVRLAAVVVMAPAKCVSRRYALDTPAAAPLTFGTATDAVAPPVTAAVLGFVTGVTSCALAVAAKDVRVCAANSS